MIDFKKIVFFIVAGVSLFIFEVIGGNISNTVAAFFISGLVWFVLFGIAYHYFEVIKTKYASRDFVVTNKQDSFPFSFDLEKSHYEGTIFPAVDKNGKGFPEYFRVDLGSSFFAAINFRNRRWQRKGGKVLIRPGEEKLFEVLGEIITTRYKIKN